MDVVSFQLCLILSASNTTNVLLNSPNDIHTFLLNSLGEFCFSYLTASSVLSIPVFSQQNNLFCIDTVRRR